MQTDTAGSTNFDILGQLDQLLQPAGLSHADAGGEVSFAGEDPIFPTVHRLGACISIPMMGSAVATAAIWRQRTGRGQSLSVDLRQAIHGINPVYRFKPTVNGHAYQMPYAFDNPMTFTLYQTGDNRWFLPTGAYPSLLHAWCRFLRCPPETSSIANAISKWNGLELDEAAAEKGLVFALCRSAEEWRAHPQGKLLHDAPVVEIVKIADSDPEPFTAAERPLAGVRVLNATHVIAGNVMSRTLAEQGADVLGLAHPQEFEHEAFYVDPCVGFRSTWLDLHNPADNKQALALASRADVFVENYRGRSIANLGMSPQALAERRPGIIYASARCYSYDGPWANRPGFDMEALCVSGFAFEEGTPDRPKFPPTMVMNDYIAGYIGAIGIQAALIRRAKEGGSYHVRVNLARCAMWFMSLGKFDRDRVPQEADPHLDHPPLALTAQTPYGELVRLAPAVQFSETHGRWQDPVLTVRGSCRPEWLQA